MVLDWGSRPQSARSGAAWLKIFFFFILFKDFQSTVAEPANDVVHKCLLPPFSVRLANQADQHAVGTRFIRAKKLPVSFFRAFDAVFLGGPDFLGASCAVEKKKRNELCFFAARGTPSPPTRLIFRSTLPAPVLRFAALLQAGKVRGRELELIVTAHGRQPQFRPVGCKIEIPLIFASYRGLAR